jgi:hypothetical protein
VECEEFALSSQFLCVNLPSVTGTSLVCMYTKTNVHSNPMSDDSQVSHTHTHTRWHTAFLGFDLEIVKYLENLIAKIEDEEER